MKENSIEKETITAQDSATNQSESISISPVKDIIKQELTEALTFQEKLLAMQETEQSNEVFTYDSLLLSITFEDCFLLEIRRGSEEGIYVRFKSASSDCWKAIGCFAYNIDEFDVVMNCISETCDGLISDGYEPIYRRLGENKK